MDFSYVSDKLNHTYYEPFDLAIDEIDYYVNVFLLNGKLMLKVNKILLFKIKHANYFDTIPDSRQMS